VHEEERTDRPRILRILALTALVAAACLASSALPASWQYHDYTAVNLVSDIPGVALVTDPAVKDAWGFAYTPHGPMFLVNTNSGFATPYDVNGHTDRVQKAAPDLAIPSLAPFPFGGSSEESPGFGLDNGVHLRSLSHAA
jgi:hypothetical protein